MRILVTGAAGFVGYHVARRLLARGDSVVGFDNVNDYYDPGLKEARLAELARMAKRGFSYYAIGRGLPLPDVPGTGARAVAAA